MKYKNTLIWGVYYFALWFIYAKSAARTADPRSVSQMSARALLLPLSAPESRFHSICGIPCDPARVLRRRNTPTDVRSMGARCAPALTALLSMPAALGPCGMCTGASDRGCVPGRPPTHLLSGLAPLSSRWPARADEPKACLRAASGLRAPLLGRYPLARCARAMTSTSPTSTATATPGARLCTACLCSEFNRVRRACAWNRVRRNI